MSQRNNSSRALVLAAAFAVAIPSLSSLVEAGPIWDGGGTGNGWTNAGNWDNDTAPAFNSSASLVFGAAGFARASSNLQGSLTVGALTFNSNVPTGGVGISFFSLSGTNQSAGSLTMGGAGSASITVDSGVTQSVILGSNSGSGSASTYGNLILADQLTINQNTSSATLLINRPITGAGFGITKTGAGTLRVSNYNSFTGPINLNGGRWIAASFPNSSADAGKDLDTSSGLVFGGGSLDIQLPNFSGAAKAYTLPITVNSAGTLTYTSLDSTTSRNLSLGGTNSFTLNADLTVANTSTSTTLTSGVDISRALTGTGKIVVSTNTVINSGTDSATPQRVQLSGDNSLWSGGLWVSKGSGVFSPTSTTNPAGTGPITVGVTGSASAASLGFNQSSGVSPTLSNAIVVRSGGLRVIRNNGQFATNILFTGPVTLEGDLTVNSAMNADRFISFSGGMSGAGGVNVVNSGTVGAYVRIGGTNSYTGPTSVASNATLLVSGSLTSSITLASNATLGAKGSTTGGVTFGAGSTFSYDGASTTNYFTASGIVDTTAGATAKINVRMTNQPTSGTGIVLLQAGTLQTNGVSDFNLVGTIRGSLAVSANQLLFNHVAGNVVWKGSNATSPTFWNTNTPTGNFTLNGASDFFVANDNVLFDDTASNFAPAVQAPLSAGVLTFNNTANNYTVSGASVSSTGIVKNGTGTVVLNNNNSVAGSVTVNSGLLIVNTPLRPVTGSLVVTGPGALVQLGAPATSVAATGYTVAGEFASVSVAASSTVVIPAVDRAANKANVLVTGGLDLAGTMNLGTSDMIIKGGVASIAAVRGWLASGTLTSSGVSAVAPYTTLSLFPNDAGNGIAKYFDTYDGVTDLAVSDLIVKYTYVGDTNLDGKLDGTDLNQVLEGYSTGQTGWAWGDVNHSGGAVDAADVAAFLAAYSYYQSNPQIPLGSGQGGVGASGAVPEPAALGLLAAAVPMISRRRRR